MLFLFCSHTLGIIWGWGWILLTFSYPVLNLETSMECLLNKYRWNEWSRAPALPILPYPGLLTLLCLFMLLRSASPSLPQPFSFISLSTITQALPATEDTSETTPLSHLLKFFVSPDMVNKPWRNQFKFLSFYSKAKSTTCAKWNEN